MYQKFLISLWWGSKLMGSVVTRPVQFNITNHINKCRDEAIQQQQWIDSGKLYYSSTINLFKERAVELRRIADMYENMYMHFNPAELPDEEIIQVVDTSDSDISDISITSELNCTVSEKSDDRPLSEYPTVDLIEKLNQSKKSNYTDKRNIKIASCLKYKLGHGIDTLDETFPYSETSIPNLFSYTVVNWFKERCNWPSVNRTNKLRYNLGSFNKSLDALILAFCASLYKYDSFNLDNVHEFIKEQKYWLYSEGENHNRGEPNPYASEKGGLVSRDVVKYMEGSNNELTSLISPKCASNVYYLSVYLENMIKSILYSDSTESEVSDRYFHSVRNRVPLDCCPDISTLTQDKLQSIVANGGE